MRITLRALQAATVHYIAVLTPYPIPIHVVAMAF